MAHSSTLLYPELPPSGSQADVRWRHIRHASTHRGEEFVRDFLDDQASMATTLMDSIAEIKDAHVSFTLLCSCAGACRFNYLLRVTLADRCHATTTKFDRHMKRTIRLIVGGVLHHSIYKELTLPVSTKIPSFGAGLISTQDVKTAAYISPNLLTSTTIATTISKDTTTTSKNKAISSDYASWRNQIDELQRITVQ